MAGTLSKIQKWGNSQGIRIPKTIMETLNWNNNTMVEITTNEDTIMLKKVEIPHKRKNIKELFADYNENYTPKEFDWGKKKIVKYGETRRHHNN